MDATERVMTREGPAGVTFGSIVEESGLSKSGVIHHFRSKRQILEALAARTMSGFANVLRIGGNPSDRGARTRAYAECLFAPEAAPWPMHRIAALLNAPDLLDPMIEGHRALDQLEQHLDHEDHVQVMLTRMALDGLWWSDLIDPERLSARERGRVMRLLVPDDPPP